MSKRARGLISLVEASYSLEGDDSDWLRGLCEAANPLIGRGLGVAAVKYDTVRGDWIDLVGMNAVDVEPRMFGAIFGHEDTSPAEVREVVKLYRTRSVWTGRKVLASLDVPSLERRAEAARASGFPNADMFGAMCADTTGKGCLLVAFSDQPIELHPRTTSRWARAAVHIATGLRIRDRLRALGAAILTESPDAEAILNASGKSEHAVGRAKEPAMQDRLRDAVATLERARSRTTTPEEALELWSALVEGRWSLLDCFDRDGRRFWVAHTNGPHVMPHRRLTASERRVAALVSLGQPNKLIAYELGISIATVARQLRRARAKLGFSSRRAMIQALSAEHVVERTRHR